MTDLLPRVGASTAPRSAELVESVAPADPLIGTVVRVRRSFRREASVVIGIRGDGRVEVVRPTGEVSFVRPRKVKATLAEPIADVRSAPGRLLCFLNSSEFKDLRPEAAAVAVRARFDELAAVREHAMGLLLDSRWLSMNLSECLALPLEPWRVRYEFLNGREATELATGLIADTRAPTEVRALVALCCGTDSVKRYLTDEFPEPQSLPGEIAGGVIQLREALYQPGSGILRDPVLEELLAVIASAGETQPSEQLLADRSVWGLLLESGATGEWSNGPHSAEFAGLIAVRRAKEALLEWRWDDAKSIAREGLRQARGEQVRDELLNIVACALWLQGEPEPALAALDSALEGAYTDALLINASIIATELEHDSAMDRLARLAREAPSAQQRAVAAERALVLWDTIDSRVWEDSDEAALPPEIRDALRTLIGEALPEDRYLRILRVLANRDDEWLAAQRDAAFGPNAGGTVARIYRGRAAGLEKFIEAIAAEIKTGRAPTWVEQERDDIVEAATQVLFERNDELPAAYFGMTLLESNLPMKPEHTVALKCLTVGAVAQSVSGEGGEPQLRFIDWVEEAKRDLRLLDAEDRERLGGLVGMAANALAASYLMARAAQFEYAEQAWNRLCIEAAQVLFSNTPARLNMRKVREGLSPVAEFCRETESLLARLEPLVRNEFLQDRITELNGQAVALRRKVDNPTESEMYGTAVGLINQHGSGRFRP